MWGKQLLNEIGCEFLVTRPIRIYGDNMAANKLTKEHFIGTGNQYIYTPYFYIQELVNNAHITDVMHVPTKINISDLHTKSVARQTVQMLVPKANGYDPTWTHVLTLPKRVGER